MDHLPSVAETQDGVCSTKALADVPDRHERQRKARAVRRSLADITPSNSRPQDQSLLFSKLPAEIRFMIFQLLLSQTHDLERPVDFHSLSPLYRPGHTFGTKIHAAVLLTCRLVYYEAHAIPIKSATHHSRHLGTFSWLYDGDFWLYHMTKQRGADLYHLHDNVVDLKRIKLTKFFLPHLHWKRITWTICAYLWPPILAQYREIDRLSEALAGIQLPSSCQEVNLEFEIWDDVPEVQESLQRQIELCQKTGVRSDTDPHSDCAQQEDVQQPAGLRRNDGSVLQFDPEHSKRYTWTGNGQARWGFSALIRDKEMVTYRTTRLCWRARVPRREYMGYDHLDCLDLTKCEEVKGIEDESADNKARQVSW